MNTDKLILMYTAVATCRSERSRTDQIRDIPVRAVQILLGHAKIESTVRYLGVDVEDALELAEATEV